MIGFKNGIITLHAPDWMCRLVFGRKRYDAALKSLHERAAAHGHARVTLELNRAVKLEMGAERVD